MKIFYASSLSQQNDGNNVLIGENSSCDLHMQLGLE